MSGNTQADDPLLTENENESQSTGSLPPMQYYPAPSYAPLQPMANPVHSQQSNANTVVVQQPGATYVSAPRQPESFLFLAIFAGFCCFWPTAIVALIHSCQVSSRYGAGDFAGAEEASRKAYFWSKISIIVGLVAGLVVFAIVVIIPIVLSAGVAAASS